MTQRYTQKLARERMAEHLCPECGGHVYEHDGRGGPRGCPLTDNGVLDRIEQYLKDRDGR